MECCRRSQDATEEGAAIVGDSGKGMVRIFELNGIWIDGSEGGGQMEDVRDGKRSLCGGNSGIIPQKCRFGKSKSVSCSVV